MNGREMSTSEGIFKIDNEIKDDLSCNNNSSNVNFCEADCDIQALYSGEEAKGFDLSNGSEWIYPTNYPVRSYQKNIVSNALFKNTLVCLPTGLGKTFIAAVVMYNYHRWYPKNLIVFMAHSKPLVTQQVNACSDIMGISPSDIAELNGHMIHSNRKKQWESKKIFFLTPQVFNNDLARGNVKAENIRCIVIDEAHKALGNQAYCQVIRSIKPFNSNFRVLALSATPGDDMNMVKEVIQNLMISHLELRTENDTDIKPYIHGKKIETIVVKLDDVIMEVKERFLRAVDKYIKPLVQNKILPQSFSSLNPFSLVLKQRQFIQNPSVRDDLRGIMLSNFSVAISLFYALEELTIHGLRTFLTKLKSLQSKNNASNKVNCRIASDEELRSLVEYIENYLGPDNNVSFDPNSSLTRLFDDIDNINTVSGIPYSHPKFAVLENVVQNHFRENKESTRIIIFCKSRQCTGEICNFLSRFRPTVKPMIFIGQSQSSGGIVTKGFNQAAQQTVMKRFRDGIYNTLIATCVAEEGLDIGEVDLIINFDSGKSSNTQIQRNGRTGRKRDGRVVNLVTEGKEHQNYNISVSKGKKMNKRLVDDGKNLPFYTGNPRLIPKGLNPTCQEIYFSTKKSTNEDVDKTNKKTKTASKKKLQEPSKNRNTKKIKKMKEINSTEKNICMSSESVLTSRKKHDAYSFVNQKDENHSDELHKKNDESNEEGNKEIVNHIGGKYKTKDVRDNSQHFTSEKYMEPSELDTYEKSVTVLIKNDSNAKANYSWEYVPHEQLENETKNLLVQFLHSSRSPLNIKNTFSVVLNKKLSEISKKKNTDLIRNLEKCESYMLSESGLNYLANQDLDTQSIAIYLNEARNKVFRKADIKSKDLKEIPSEKEQIKFSENLKEEIKIEDDMDMDDFLHVAQTNFKSSFPAFISSTPLRKTERYSDNEKENIIDNNLPCTSKTCKTDDNLKSNLPESNFQLWDESDFFNVQENSIQKEETRALIQSPNIKKKKNATLKDSSMISITQALDFITNADFKFFNYQLTSNNENANISLSPTSPVLFYSQKRKISQGRNTYVSSSPILSQHFKEKKVSRKRLVYKSINDEKILSKDKSVIEKSEAAIEHTGQSDDLFADTEMALQNHLQKSQFTSENIKEMSDEKSNKLCSENIVQSQRDSDDNTMDYDLGKTNIDYVKILSNVTNDESLALNQDKEKSIFKKDENKSFISLENLSKNKNFSKNPYNKANNFNGTSIEAGSFSIPNSTKSAPKMAIVRPLGFENMLLTQNASFDCDKKGIGEEKSKSDAVTGWKNQQENNCHPDFTCNFSLFDDFNKNCLNEVQTENVNKKEKGKTILISSEKDNNNKKMNCLNGMNRFKSDDDCASNDSDVFNTIECRRKTDNNQTIYIDNSENSVQKEIEHFKNMSDSGDLSDGAIQAIKAIEEYEYNQKMSNKILTNRTETRKKFVFDLDSDDSEEFFLPVKKQEKQGNSSSCISRVEALRSSKDKDEKKSPVNEFIEMEAKLSDKEQISSDEENTSGLDEYDSSFVDERENLTQAPNIDMTAKYLQTIKSPVRAGAFKIPQLKDRDDLNVFSQIEVENESDYEQDSFCVKEEEEKSFETNSEMTELELAEIILESKGKRKRKNIESKVCSTKKKRKFKRVLRIESESSDDEGDASNEVKNSKVLATNCSDIQELFALPFEEENKLKFEASSCDGSKEHILEPIVFVASRQIASAPEITTALRAKWNVNVQVRSAPEADYIVSWRMGINRIYLSDFASGSPAAKTSLRENVLRLMLNFHQPTLIVEDDKSKGLPRTVGCHKTLWATHAYKMLAKLVQNNVKLLFSRSKDDTAKIIVLLCKEEKNKGHAISLEEQSEIDSKIQFFSLLPGINIANAVRISHKFSSIGSFMMNCKSVNNLMREIGVKKEAAVKIYRLLFSIPCS